MKAKTRIVPNSTELPNTDPFYPAAVENAKEAFRKLREAGIVDAQGNRLRTDLPADMQEGKDRDFGG